MVGGPMDGEVLRAPDTRPLQFQQPVPLTVNFQHVPELLAHARADKSDCTCLECIAKNVIRYELLRCEGNVAYYRPANYKL